jgi:hypothetical protein
MVGTGKGRSSLTTIGHVVAAPDHGLGDPLAMVSAFIPICDDDTMDVAEPPEENDPLGAGEVRTNATLVSFEMA